MSIKRIQRGLIYGEINDAEDVPLKKEIKLEHEINPEKCIVNLRDRIQFKSLECSNILSSLVLNLTSTVLTVAPALDLTTSVPNTTMLSGLKPFIIQTSWEIIEYE